MSSIWVELVRGMPCHVFCTLFLKLTLLLQMTIMFNFKKKIEI